MTASQDEERADVTYLQHNYYYVTTVLWLGRWESKLLGKMKIGQILGSYTCYKWLDVQLAAGN